MIVCLCKVVSDRAIRAARDGGAHTVEAIGAATGAGTGCGCCKGAIAALLAEPLVELRRPDASPAPRASGDDVPRRAAAKAREIP